MARLTALIFATSLAALAANAQSAPDYTFGPAFNNGMPRMYPGPLNGYNASAVPGGFYGGNQSPFLTMPAPVHPDSRSQTTQWSGLPQARPLPYWMQTPQNRPPAAHPTYTAPRFAPSAPESTGWVLYPPTVRAAPHNTTAPSTPPRWAPRSGQMPAIAQHRPSGNSWQMAPRAAAAPTAPAKWHSE